MTRQEKLDALLSLKDPHAYAQKLMTDRSMAELVLQMEKVQGLKGDTPVKGKDYFTPEEIQGFISYLRAQIPAPIKGDKGDFVKGEQGKPGAAGATPRRGVDYWTPKDVETMTAEVIKKMPKPEKVIKAETKPIKYSDLMDAPDLTDLPKLIQFLKAGGFRGGGDTVAAGSGVTITTVNGVKSISSTGGGGGSGYQTPISGVVNGSNKTFVWAVAPNVIVVDGVPINAISSDGSPNWTGTTTTVLTIAPNNNIFATA
jgi:hypothetical protein